MIEPPKLPSEPFNANDATRVPDDLIEALSLAVGDVEPFAQADHAAVKQRLLARVRASDAGGTTTIKAEEGQWESFSPKVKIKVLRSEGDTMSYLLRLDAGAMVVPHRHRLDEECIVMEGEIIISDKRIGAGAYHLAPRGIDHVPIRSETGALLFLRGAAPTWRDVSKWDSIRAAFGAI